jgi:cyanophycinase
MSKPRGTLIIIGGHEEKEPERERPILEEVARHAKGPDRRLVIVTVASQLPDEMARDYKRVFEDLGVSHVDHLELREREDAKNEKVVRQIEAASVIFFTGGDQLRITSQVGDSPVYQCMQKRYREGACVAGTSAGAAAMPETMLISGSGDKGPEMSALGMAPGLGLVTGVVIDSHFAERGRMGRLLAAVAENPKNLGLGIDEDTAIVLSPDRCFRVIGSGGVHVVDGACIDYSSLSERRPEGALSIFGIKLHVLAHGDCFDLDEREPSKDGRGR